MIASKVLLSQRASVLVIGASAIVFASLYVLSDVMELLAGGLFTEQLVVTYVAEATIPFYVLGLNAVQQPRGGWLGSIGAVLYGFAFVGFAATVLHPLVTGMRDADEVFTAFGVIYDVHAALALAGGVAFGASVIRAGVFPRWTGLLLIGGLVVTASFSLTGLTERVQTLGTALRSLAFAGMGASCLGVGARANSDA
jgi:hypothetical protein